MAIFLTGDARKKTKSLLRDAMMDIMKLLLDAGSSRF